MMEAKYAEWRSGYLRRCAEGMYCWYNGRGEHGDAVTCSEAHGYAMLISVLHDSQADFDQLFSFYLRFKNVNGLMCWQIRKHEDDLGECYVAEDGQTSATDGDIDIAASLYQAAKVFAPSPMFPPTAYLDEANALTARILTHAIHPQLKTPFLGDWVNQDSPEGVRLYNATRSSDFILSAFLLFSRAHCDSAQRHRWSEVLEATRQVAIQCSAQNSAGLLPDFLEHRNYWAPAKGQLLESSDDGNVSWNACRTPWRLAHYFAVSNDHSIFPLLQQQHHSVRNNSAFNFPAIPAGFHLARQTAMVDYTDKAFIAPIGYLCHVLGDAHGQQQCVRALSDQASTYFGDTIDVLIALQATHVGDWL